MEEFLTLLIPVLLGALLVRLLLLPLKVIWKVGLYSFCGLICLWLLNWVAPLTGAHLPVNAVTVSLAGVLGVPGIGLVALLAVL